MFQFLLLTGSIIAFIIGGLAVLIGIGVITGCAGGLVIMLAGGLIAFFGVWSVVSFFLPAPAPAPAAGGIITLYRREGKWS